MPDPTFWGWIAAGAVGSAFMWLLRRYLDHLEKDVTRSQRAGERAVRAGEAAADHLERAAAHGDD